MDEIKEILNKWKYADGYIHIEDAANEIQTLKEKWEGEAVMGFVKTLPEKITNVVGGYPLRVEIKARWKEWVSGKCRFCGEPLSIENKLRKEGIGVKGFCNNEECERYLTKTKEQEGEL